jgi:TolB-like protein/DNA-binding winged helix-turn-helix (wHTH) protein/thioredoxin-like negative regulator of GroEL
MDAPAERGAESALEQGFRLGELTVHPPTGDVAGPGGRVRLDPKVMGVLMYLARHVGQVVARETLLAELWPGSVVTDDALSRCLYELRRQLNVAGGGAEYGRRIDTLPRRGYRLNEEVAPLLARDAAPGQRPARRRLAWAALALVAVLVALAGYRALLPPAQPAGSSAPRYSVAVLPFADMSETQDQRYFCDGTAEEILNRLAQSPSLGVIARTSSFSFRDQPLDVPEIARRLEVTHVLEGSVRKVGDRVRVTAQLIAGTDGTHVWSATYERTLGDVFAVQREVASAVAAALQASLAPDAQAPAPAANLEAYDLVLQAAYIYNRRGEGDVERAARLLERAVQIDPRYARAWADLSGAYGLHAPSVEFPATALREKQGLAALRAVELDPSLAVAHLRLANYYNSRMDGGDRARAREHVELARKLAPEEPLILSSRAAAALEAGDLQTAADLLRRAVRRDPMNITLRVNYAVMLLAIGVYDEALSAYQWVLDIVPDPATNGLVPEIKVDMAWIQVLQGNYEQAAAAAQELPPGQHRDHAVAMLSAAPGRRENADAALNRLETYPPGATDTTGDLIMDSVRLAQAYALRGMADEAFATLQDRLETLQTGPDAVGWIEHLHHELRLAPFLGPLHADPRWAVLLAEPI